MPVIDFYELAASPPCRAVKMTAKLLGLDLKIHNVDLFKKEHYESDYLKMNPFHKVPTINDNGFYLFESRAIMLYLINKYAPDSALYPTDPQKRAMVDQMLNVDNGVIFPSGVGVLRPQIFEGKLPTADAITKAKDGLQSLNTLLSTRKFAAGDDLTLADISLAPTLSCFEMADLDMSDYPKVSEYVSRVRSKLSPMYEEVNDTLVAAILVRAKEMTGHSEKLI